MVVGSSNFEGHDYVYQWDGRSNSNFVQLNSVLPSVQSLGEGMIRAPSSWENSDFYKRSHLLNLEAPKDKNDEPHFALAQGKELSLTLGSHLPTEELIPSFNYRQMNPHMNYVSNDDIIDREDLREVHSSFCRGETIGNGYSSTASQSHCGSAANELASLTFVIRNSRFLKPTQELLDEIISVNKGVVFDSDKQLSLQDGRMLRMATTEDKPVNYHKRSLASSSDFSSAEEQAIHNKITQLTSLLNELDNRYKVYCQQLEAVVSSFEMVAGSGATKSYTALALQAMSRHFSTLRNIIISKLRLSKRDLSDDLPRIRGGLSQLNLFDQSARQKKAAIQQYGMFQVQQPWRPLRGLPENSVVILRAWLFEHFLHPYPNDSEKLMLASQTGLTRNQVSNWFINARVRLWKPMIEEMYREEFANLSPEAQP